MEDEISPGVLRPSACQTGVLCPQSLALGLGPGQAQYLGLNPCLFHSSSLSDGVGALGSAAVYTREENKLGLFLLLPLFSISSNYFHYLPITNYRPFYEVICSNDVDKM